MNQITDTAKILIVDDEPLNVKLLRASLSNQSYVIACAYDGSEALEKIKMDPPDLILLDIMMPGLNGYELTGKLKGNPLTKDIPIILITALNSTEDKIKGLEAGADEFLNKPISTAELLARVKSLLRLRQYQEQLKTRAQSREMIMGPEIPQTGELHLPSILVVEDDEKDARLIQMQLQNQPYTVSLVRTGEEAITRIQQQKVDLVLLDILLPGIDGFGVLRYLKEREPTRDIQVVAVTCLSDLENKIRGIETGADDYLVKPINVHELRVRINSLIRKKAYLDRLQSGYERAAHSAVTDQRTGLYNYAYFHHFLNVEIKRSLRQNHPIALLMMDIDRFKQINDQFGHLAGDEVLRIFGKLLLENVRDIDLGVRYGGEEFAVVLPYTDREAAHAVGERLKDIIENYTFVLNHGGVNTRITVSIGVAVYPVDADCAETLIHKADNALYRAKKEGKNRVYLYEPDDSHCG